MPPTHTNHFRQSILEKYQKRITRLRKAVLEGKFSRYSADKKRILLLSLSKYERQLSHWGIAFAAGAVLLLPVYPVLAQTPVPVGSEFRVNSYTTSSQDYPSVDMDSNGNFVVAWVSLQGGNVDIYARRYDNTGLAQGAEFRVNTYTTATQSFPSVAMDSAGDFVVTWQSGGQDGNTTGIYAQRYDNSGAAQGSEFRVNSYTTFDQVYSSVDMDSDGAFVVTWESQYQDGSFYGIYAQRFDNTGIPQGTEFRVNTFTLNWQKIPSVSMDSDGDFVVTWQSLGQDGSSDGIYAQRYDNTGTPQGAEFRVNTYTTNNQRSPSVAMDSDGDFVVTWTSQNQDGNGFGIYAQRYDNTGTPQGTEFRVNSYITNMKYSPSVDMDINGDFVVAWHSDYQDGSSSGVYAQRYDYSGTARGVEFSVNTYTTNTQAASSIAMDSDGDFVVTWMSYIQDGSNFGIYAQRYALPPLLPIELLYFTGQVQSTTNILEWATATEKNTAWQILERSANGLDDWTEIGRVAGAGNSTAPISYKISDENPLLLGLYRLVAEDFDGSIQHSEIISLQRSGSGLSILNVFPQPAGNELRLELYAPASGIVTVSMTDILGRKVLDQECAVQRGIHQLVLDTSGLPPGRYQAMVSDGDHWVTRAVVK